MYRLVVYKLFLFLAVLLLSACMQGESNVESGNQQQIFHFGNGAEVQGIDPHVVTGVAGHHVVQSLFEGLVLKDAKTLEVIPGAAERWDVSDDGRYTPFISETMRVGRMVIKSPRLILNGLGGARYNQP